MQAKLRRPNAEKRGVSVAKKTLVKPLVKNAPEARKKPKMSPMGIDTALPVETLWTHGRWGRAIKQWRKKVGWSANDLAKALGVSRSYIKHIESDKNGWEVRPRIEKQLRALMQNTPSALPQSKCALVTIAHTAPRWRYAGRYVRRLKNGSCRGLMTESSRARMIGRKCLTSANRQKSFSTASNRTPSNTSTSAASCPASASNFRAGLAHGRVT